MKLEVGMYCYDKCNRELGIGKILTEPSKNNNVGIIYKHGHAPVVSVGNVIASHNIIDLIEVGDYVNGFKVIRRFVNIHNGKKLLIALEKEEGYEYSNNLNDYMGDDSIHIYNEDIKTIVTKQQFESMQYEVE